MSPIANSHENGALVGTLRDHGFRSARSGLVFEGCRTLRAAAAHDPTDPRVWEVLGLCSFSTGNIAEARQCWESATAKNPESPATTWLRELSSGSIASALTDYRHALEEARSGWYETAATTIAGVREAVPDFAPAGCLEGVIFAAQGETPLAREAWQKQLRLVRDDPALRRLLTEVTEPEIVTPHPRKLLRSMFRGRAPLWATIVSAAMIAVVIVHFSIRRHGAEHASAAGPPSVAESRAEVQVPTALAGKATADVSAGAHSSKGATAGTRASERSLGWQLFVDGRRDAERGALATAVKKLSQAVSYGAGAFYHDDALYSLARAQAKAGDSQAASATATKLLREYPKSIFANSVTVKIAQMSHGPLP